MRQAVIQRHGPPDVFAMRDVPVPEPGTGELRIRVRASGVNFADILARMGLYPDAPPPPLVVGYEVSGHVDRLGEGVIGMSEGDQVVALTRFGGYSESVVVPATLTYRVPPDLSDAEAAAFPVNYLTAALALYRMAALNAGDVVLIHNAGGGVGIAATQLARLRRATVIGTASAFKHAALRSFGVEHAIDHQHANIAHEVMKITKGRGVDVILDPIGGRSFQSSYRMLAPLGRLILLGLSAASTGERRNLCGRVSRLDDDATVQPDVADKPEPRRVRHEHRSSVGRAPSVDATHGDAARRARCRPPEARRSPNVPARESGRRSPLHSEPIEYWQSRAHYLTLIKHCRSPWFVVRISAKLPVQTRTTDADRAHRFASSLAGRRATNYEPRTTALFLATICLQS